MLMLKEDLHNIKINIHILKKITSFMEANWVHTFKNNI